MTQITPDSFATICFIVLMQNGAGVLDKSPDYIGEKVLLMSAGFDAFAYLDIHNMRKVMAWLDRWGIEAPEVIRNEMDLQERAASDLIARGINI
jgi:hypothetical protein